MFKRKTSLICYSIKLFVYSSKIISRKMHGNRSIYHLNDVRLYVNFR